MKCLNIIIFYENREEVQNYISEIASIADGLVDIALVVNSDKNSQVQAMSDELRLKGVSCFQIIDYQENVGYLNSLLKTIKIVDVNKYDYIILSNTDIQYEMKDFFQKLLSKKYDSSIGCIAPSVYASRTSSFSNPHYLERIPRDKLEFLSRLFKYPMLAKCYLKLGGWKAKRKKSLKKPSCYVYSPHGCYMIFTKAFINKILEYEYGVKMYSEESAIGELLLKHKMKCYYDNTISVIHQESTVTGKINYKKRFAAWQESLDYIIQEFY